MLVIFAMALVNWMARLTTTSKIGPISNKYCLFYFSDIVCIGVIPCKMILMMRNTNEENRWNRTTCTNFLFSIIFVATAAKHWISRKNQCEHQLKQNNYVICVCVSICLLANKSILVLVKLTFLFYARAHFSHFHSPSVSFLPPISIIFRSELWVKQLRIRL